LDIIETTIIADSLKQLNISATNFAGEFQAINVNVKMTLLQSPERLIRPRYWDAPDTSIMSKEEFLRNFPHDEYMDENAKINWKQLKTIYEGSSVLAPDKKFSLGKISIDPGWYLIEVSAKDK